jgi:hypothetical protein
LNHLIPLLDEEVKPRTNSSAQQFFKNVTAANFRLQHLSPHLTKCTYQIIIMGSWPGFSSFIFLIIFNAVQIRGFQKGKGQTLNFSYIKDAHNKRK